MGARKSVKTRAKQGQNVEEASLEKCWRVKKGGQIFEIRQTKRERRKKDTVSRGGLLEVGIGEMCQKVSQGYARSLAFSEPH